MPAVSLRLRLMLIFLILSLITILTSGLLLLSNARSAIQNEVAASHNLANSLIDESMKSVTNYATAEQFLGTLPLKFRQVRHIRIRVFDAVGNELTAKPTFFFSQTGNQEQDEAQSPEWFRTLLWSREAATRIPIRQGNAQYGYVTLVAEPLDEINEIWADILVLMKIAGFSLVALLTSIHLALGHALKPIDNIANGLKALEGGDYKFRIPTINSPELSRIGEGFNDLARKLNNVYKEREKLSQRLVSVQDQERRHIAQELHDEFGPCLFGIKSNASSISNYLQKEQSPANEPYNEKIRSVLEIVSHMEACNRDLLNKLRPMALGEVDLSELIEKLVSTFRLRHQNIAWSLHLEEPLPSFGETIDLTVYRFIQESLTNVIRHARATSVCISVSEEQLINLKGNGTEKQSELIMSVSDDGIGFSEASHPGHGIKGLEERVEALGGKFAISENQPHGLKVEARIRPPLNG